MKSVKRFFILLLCAIILVFNITMFAYKPIQTKAAAVAVPAAAEVGTVLWNLLMTAFVACGAYEILDNYDLQKNAYDTFLSNVKSGEITIPEGGIIINDPLVGTSVWDQGQLDHLEELMGWTPKGGSGQEPDDPKGDNPPEEPKPSDKDAWKTIGKNVSFAASGAFLSKLGDFVKSVFDDKESELSKQLFDSSSLSASGWTGEYIFNEDGSYYISAHASGYKRSYYNGQAYSVDFKLSIPDLLPCKGKCAAYLENGMTLYTYQENVSEKGYGVYGLPWAVDNFYYGGVNKYVSSISSYEKPFTSIDISMPVFTSFAALETYFLTGVTAAAINGPKPIDFTKTVPQVSSLLSPMTQTDTHTGKQTQLQTQTLIDTLTQTQTQVQAQPQMDTDTYTKVFTDSLTDAITKTQTQTSMQPSYPNVNATGTKGEGLTRDWKLVFPFCIPFDMISIIRVLSAEPQAPRFEFPIRSEKYDIDYTFVIDLSDFEPVAKIFRLGETILFMIGLMTVTSSVIKW